jgi:hypothetical protein
MRIKPGFGLAAIGEYCLSLDYARSIAPGLGFVSKGGMKFAWILREAVIHSRSTVTAKYS